MNVDKIFKFLPAQLVNELTEAGIPEADEVRLRLGCPCSYTVGTVNHVLHTLLSKSDMRDTVNRLCNGSVHTHGDEMSNGFISAGEGIRAGICGVMTNQGNISEVTSVNIRLPKHIRGVCGPALQYVDEGLLICAPPSGGKTTLLRDIAASLSSKPIFKRVALIDCRNELYISGLFDNSTIDVFSGYTKEGGIETATRTMSPEYIVCDEIGGYAEAESILTAQNTGIPLIASAHADNIVSLMKRKNIRLLHEARVFSTYAVIHRADGKFRFSFTKWSEAEKCI